VVHRSGSAQLFALTVATGNLIWTAAVGGTLFAQRAVRARTVRWSRFPTTPHRPRCGQPMPGSC